jgi:hypothetical protein
MTSNGYHPLDEHRAHGRPTDQLTLEEIKAESLLITTLAATCGDFVLFLLESDCAVASSGVGRPLLLMKALARDCLVH